MQTLGQFLQTVKKSHKEDGFRIMRYVKGSPGQGILISSMQNNTITACYDSDWIFYPNFKSLVSGHLVKFRDSHI